LRAPPTSLNGDKRAFEGRGRGGGGGVACTVAGPRRDTQHSVTFALPHQAGAAARPSLAPIPPLVRTFSWQIVDCYRPYIRVYDGGYPTPGADERTTIKSMINSVWAETASVARGYTHVYQRVHLRKVSEDVSKMVSRHRTGTVQRDLTTPVENITSVVATLEKLLNAKAKHEGPSVVNGRRSIKDALDAAKRLHAMIEWSWSKLQQPDTPTPVRSPHRSPTVWCVAPVRCRPLTSGCCVAFRSFLWPKRSWPPCWCTPMHRTPHKKKRAPWSATRLRTAFL
jgi:hypothetical protein